MATVDPIQSGTSTTIPASHRPRWATLTNTSTSTASSHSPGTNAADDRRATTTALKQLARVDCPCMKRQQASTIRPSAGSARERVRDRTGTDVRSTVQEPERGLEPLTYALQERCSTS
jgi:hypothetical protein